MKVVVRIPSNFVIRTILVARQAWRSIGFLALNPPCLWSGFQEFYEEGERRIELETACAHLEQGFPSVTRLWQVLSPVRPLPKCRLVSREATDQALQLLTQFGS